MGNVIDLDQERAKRRKLRGLTQAELAMYRHDGRLSIDVTARRAAEASQKIPIAQMPDRR